MAKLPSTGLIVVPQPSISMARVLGANTSASVGARHCPLVFCDERPTRSELAGAFCRRGAAVWGAEPPGRANRGSVPFLEDIHMGAGSGVTSHSEHD